MNVRIRMVALCITAAFVATGCASIPVPFSGLASKLGGLFSGSGSGAKSAQQKSAQKAAPKKAAQESAQKASQKSLQKAMRQSAQNSKNLQRKSQKNSGGTPKNLNLSKKSKQFKVKQKHYHDVQGVVVR